MLLDEGHGFQPCRKAIRADGFSRWGTIFDMSNGKTYLRG